MKSDEEQSSPPCVCVCTHPFPSAWSDVAQRESRPVETSDRMTLTPLLQSSWGRQSEDEGAGWIEGWRSGMNWRQSRGRSIRLNPAYLLPWWSRRIETFPV